MTTVRQVVVDMDLNPTPSIVFDILRITTSSGTSNYFFDTVHQYVTRINCITRQIDRQAELLIY